MYRHILTTLAAVTLCFAVGTAVAEEDPAKEAETPKLEDAKTFANVETWLREVSEKATKDVGRDIESYKRMLQIAGEAARDAGEKMLQYAELDAERIKAYKTKIGGLKQLIQFDRLSRQLDEKKSEAQEQLDKLIDELEKNEIYRSIVDSERYQQFMMKSRELYGNLTPEKFGKFKAEAKKWAAAKVEGVDPYRSLAMVVTLSESQMLTKDNPKFTEDTIKELIDFVNSDECPIAETQKKSIVMRLEGTVRRSVGSELKLYGKTLDDKDFDWDALRGKYVLVKFTASWCGPCKGEIPGMKEAYEKYHDKGLEIVSVYIWDKLENVQKAVEDEKLPWIILSEELTEKAEKPKQGEMYAIQGVPTMLMVDKEGKVMATGMRGEALKAKLDRAFRQITP